jgi:hypothetical protein
MVDDYIYDDGISIESDYGSNDDPTTTTTTTTTIQQQKF